MAKTHYDRWESEFTPVKNSANPGANANGALFETFGADLEKVLAKLKTEPEKVWTMVEAENDKWYISPGYHLVNRVGYLLTEKALDSKNPKHERYAKRDVLYF